MSKLGANIAELKSAEAVFAEVIPEMEALKTEVNNIMDEMRTGWHGVASVAYLQNMDRQIKCMDTVIDLVRDFKEYANAIAAAMEEADRAMDAMQSNLTRITHGGGGKKV